ncbi:MAG: T9SS type A sorting domain-containing protein [Chitinophagaceae bacterium]|nr:T9SS type A sorting domain-containing protein [Chitinophagaceae bacterium]
MKKNIRRIFFLLRFTIPPLLLICSNTFSYAQNVDLGKSYINVTKGLNGGTVETGDVLEIRASFVVRSGTYDSCRFRDVIPTGTSYIAGTIRVLTNEGKIYKQFTDAYGDDPGWISGSTVTIHLGYVTGSSPATAFRRGRVANTHKPSNFGSTCIMIASFRVTVTAATGTDVSTGGGTVTYKNGISPITTYTFPANTLRVYANFSICSNTIGTNSLGTEFNGTFGSGIARNRGTSLNVPLGYTYNIFDVNSPQDYYYGIANNTSTRQNYSTVNTWAKPDATSPTHRVFQVWDIIGDHTGAASLTAGNPAADTVANSNAGYMLIVNAAYRIDSAFQQTITGLCPNTYYEISCWMRNICSKCGCDSNGKGATNSTGPPYYIPTAPGDSSGVYPNITFEVDGIDYYTTGNILYTGQWVKKGFTFLTGPLQTSLLLKYFNNAPGGGGNDWALDDITVATCSPTMIYTPNTTPIVCDSNILLLTDTVRYFFNNFIYYKWQKSTNGGATWTDVTGAIGPVSPYWNGTQWEFVSSYTVPPSETTIANSGDLYRLITSTTLANLSDVLCSFTDLGSIVTMTVIDCQDALETQLLTFEGKKENQRAVLKWTTATETEPLLFDIEKSNDGVSFYKIGTLTSYNNNADLNNYYFTDPALLPNQKTYYRLLMRNNAGKVTYSRIVQLSGSGESFYFISVINPFSNVLSFDVYSDNKSKATAELINSSGATIRRKGFEINQGTNDLSLNNMSSLPSGVYFLRIISENIILQKTVLKQ